MVWETDKTPLHSAAEFGAKELTVALLSKHKLLNLPDTPWTGAHSFTPFHLAVRNGHLDVAHLLLEHGASPESSTPEGLTPLHLASITGYPEVVEFLIDAGANINAKLDTNLKSPLFYAAGNGRKETVRLLLDRGAKAKSFDDNQSTPLHWAAKRGKSECAKLLLDAGAEIDHREELNYSPLELAAQGGFLKMTSLLIDRGANVDGQNGYALMYAVTGNYPDVVREVLRAGASKKMTDSYGAGGTALHYAGRNGRVELVKLLLEEGSSDFDIDKSDSWGDTPLTETLRYLSNHSENSIKVVQLLVEHGADVNKEGCQRRFGPRSTHTVTLC